MIQIKGGIWRPLWCTQKNNDTSNTKGWSFKKMKLYPIHNQIKMLSVQRGEICGIQTSRKTVFVVVLVCFPFVFTF